MHSSSAFSRRAFAGASIALGMGDVAVSQSLATPLSSPAATPVGEALLGTPLGDIRGIQYKDHASFQGIRYGETTAGERRWTPPVASGYWDGVYDATVPGPAAPQAAEAFAAVDSLNEDCLFLNITVPGTAEPGGEKPVLVWFHGGGGTNGSGDLFNPRRMVADNDVIIVTFNWRLGIFGAFGMPGLEDSGTFGLQDCLLALSWVQENIEAFGGDKGNVTIFGESYGALVISALLTSPQSHGLYHKAIVQSTLAMQSYPAGTLMPGTEAIPSMWLSAEELYGLAAFVLPELDVNPEDEGAIDTLRSLPVEQLLPFSAVYSRYSYGNDVLPEDPTTVIASGRAANVPVLTGSTRDEGRTMVAVFTVVAGEPVTEEQYPDLVATAFPESLDAVLEEYPLSAANNATEAWSDIVTDCVWAIGQMAFNIGIDQSGPVWVYEFADRDAPPPFDTDVDFNFAAGHAVEVPYQFEVAGPPVGLTEEQWKLARTMNAYWANFARSADPNGGNLPEWSAFDGGDLVQQLAPGTDGITAVNFAERHRLEFWERILD